MLVKQLMGESVIYTYIYTYIMYIYIYMYIIARLTQWAFYRVNDSERISPNLDRKGDNLSPIGFY